MGPAPNPTPTPTPTPRKAPPHRIRGASGSPPRVVCVLPAVTSTPQLRQQIPSLPLPLPLSLPPRRRKALRGLVLEAPHEHPRTAVSPNPPPPHPGTATDRPTTYGDSAAPPPHRNRPRRRHPSVVGCCSPQTPSGAPFSSGGKLPHRGSCPTVGVGLNHALNGPAAGSGRAVGDLPPAAGYVSLPPPHIGVPQELWWEGLPPSDD